MSASPARTPKQAAINGSAIKRMGLKGNLTQAKQRVQGLQQVATVMLESMVHSADNHALASQTKTLKAKHVVPALKNIYGSCNVINTCEQINLQPYRLLVFLLPAALLRRLLDLLVRALRCFLDVLTRCGVKRHGCAHHSARRHHERRCVVDRYTGHDADQKRLSLGHVLMERQVLRFGHGYRKNGSNSKHAVYVIRRLLGQCGVRPRAVRRKPCSTSRTVRRTTLHGVRARGLHRAAGPTRRVRGPHREVRLPVVGGVQQPGPVMRAWTGRV